MVCEGTQQSIRHECCRNNGKEIPASAGMVCEGTEIVIFITALSPVLSPATLLPSAIIIRRQSPAFHQTIPAKAGISRAIALPTIFYDFCNNQFGNRGDNPQTIPAKAGISRAIALQTIFYDFCNNQFGANVAATTAKRFLLPQEWSVRERNNQFGMNVAAIAAKRFLLPQEWSVRERNNQFSANVAATAAKRFLPSQEWFAKE